MRLVFALLLSLCTPAMAHDHWINHGHYFSHVVVDPPYTGPTQCCGPLDCFMVPAKEVKADAQGLTIPGGWRMAYKDLHMSEDGQYWACWNFSGDVKVSLKCLFSPQPGT